MERINLNKIIRIGVVFVLMISTVLSTFVLYQAMKAPDVIKREINIVDYSQSSDFEYTVNLKPSKLYDINTIVGTDPNQTYFSKTVDDIYGVFTYKFTANRKDTQIKGNYDIIAVLNTDLWEKKFVLVPKKEFRGTDNVIISEVIMLDINYYNNILNNITKEIDVSPKYSELKIAFNIDTDVTSGDGEHTNESFVPTVIITSTKGAFNVQGDISKKNDGAIKKTEGEIQFDVIEKRTNFTLVTVLLIFILVAFTAVTKNRKEDVNINEKEKMFANIRKEYGDMIVYSNNSILPDVQHKIIIDSIDELVKVAEQLEEPIINSGSLFYIYDGSTIFIYSI